MTNRTKKKYEKTLIKISLVLITISIITLIILSFIKSNTTTNLFTGRATDSVSGPKPKYDSSQNPFNTISGNVSYNLSFQINIGYDYAARWKILYNIVKEVISNCESNANLERCVENGMNQKLPKNNFSIISEANNPYYDFIDYYTQCKESNSENCVCPYTPKDSSQSKFILYFLNSRTYFAEQKNRKLTQVYNSSHYDFPDQALLSQKEVISLAPKKATTPYNGLLVDKNQLSKIRITLNNGHPEIISNTKYTKMYTEKNNKNMFIFYKNNRQLYLTKQFENKPADYALKLFSQLKNDLEKNCFPAYSSPSSVPLNDVYCYATKFCNSLSKENFANLDIFSYLCSTPANLCTQMGECSQLTFPNGVTFYFFTLDNAKVEQFIYNHLPSKSPNGIKASFVSSLNLLQKNTCTLVKHRYEYFIKDTSLKEIGPLLYYNYTASKYQQEYPMFHISFYVPSQNP